MVDALVTNFHQPKTTHLLLVEALLGREGIDRCYQDALLQGYRFLSYGDGMLVV
jgi:S-adenosylmethionine:tRNA ribosyltransferase-isomerase